MEGKPTFGEKHDILAKQKLENPTPTLDQVDSFDDFSKAVDLKTLNDILGTVANKSGGDSGRELTPEQITNVYIEGVNDVSVAAISPVTNQICFNWNNARKLHTEILEEEKVNVPPGLIGLHALCHEGAHYYSKNEITQTTESVRVVTGYAEANIDIKTQVFNRIGTSLNEAVTEEVGLTVLNEYLRRTGNSNLLPADSDVLDAVSTQAYVYDRVLLHSVIEALASRLEADRMIVRQSFVREYMSNPGKVQELMRDIAAEIADTPNVEGLVSKLIAEKNSSLPDLRDGFAREEISTALLIVMNTLKLERLRDSLGLR